MPNDGIIWIDFVRKLIDLGFSNSDITESLEELNSQFKLQEAASISIR